VQFFTTGAGDWRRLLPAGAVRDLYVQIYPAGRRWADLPASLLEACRAWVECDVARADGDRLTPTIPILLQRDRAVVAPWCDALAAHTVSAVLEALPAFRQLAAQHRNAWHSAEHLLTILILWTINMWVLRRLLAGPLGRHPAHGPTGRYFIWGEELGQGPTAITGIRALPGRQGFSLCLLVTRVVQRPGLRAARRLYGAVGGVTGVDLLAGLAAGDTPATLAHRWGIEAAWLDRWLDEQVQLRVVTADRPPRLRIPVFDAAAMARLAPLCDGVAARIGDWLAADTRLEALWPQCSFAACPRPPALCMLWHNAYYAATDRLIAQGILPPFPPEAEGEWGVWLTTHPFGQASPSPTPR
jgi:hypothetical protein